MNAVQPRAQTSEPYLHSLDLLRGFAAMAICLYHTGFLLTPDYHILPGAYLSVDLFFLLSGFVISRNYDRRIAGGMSLVSFGVQRLARLYPLFFATTLVGFVAVNMRLYGETHTFGGGRAYFTLLGNLLLIPNVLRPYDIGSLFPFNGATWSIFFEFYVNILFFLCWRGLTKIRLAVLVAVCAVLLVLTAARAHSLDIGVNSADMIRAVPRVLFSFFLGVLIARSMLKPPQQSGTWQSLFCLSGLLGALCLRDLLPAAFVWLGDVLVVTLLFPVVLIAFARMQFAFHHARTSAFLGNISYSVYLLQTPLVIFYSGLPRFLLHERIAAFAPWAGVIFMPAMVTIAFLVWKYFEVPAKRAVRRWYAAAAEAVSKSA